VCFLQAHCGREHNGHHGHNGREHIGHNGREHSGHNGRECKDRPFHNKLDYDEWLVRPLPNGIDGCNSPVKAAASWSLIRVEEPFPAVRGLEELIG
jgi:hypothetical protein